ncbi:hypothetical protein [Paraburkholderia acidisoli]|uniref:Preprotein translocase subunit SecD n=1 Tax=Paraburkholderia acidisoli TaxID=2571748 RepID=A0A7Z2GN80_9BURK|nr:hypothetical protein [Paraburkholderia acidisoli]QGZ64906.1 hypothetical protein FAZ98_24180 [Paraburkholderia acidisoli]
MRAEHLLPDAVDAAQLHGVTIRKGTVGAFLVNARVWCDPDAPEAARAVAAADMSDALPALAALGLFDVLALRDPALRAWVDARIAAQRGAADLHNEVHA